MINKLSTDFSKAFYTVPHDGLLSKLKHYGIDKHIWQWISNFLKKRKQCVVVDGVSSGLVDVDSGVPQDTVLGPILILLHVNDLPSIVSSKVRLSADDCLITYFTVCPSVDNLMCLVNDSYITILML